MINALDNPAIPEALRTAAIEAAKAYINVTVAKAQHRRTLLPQAADGTLLMSGYIAQRRPHHAAQQQARAALEDAIDAMVAAS